MKTQRYNPSPLEQELASAIADLQPALSERLSCEITKIEPTLQADNPKLHFHLRDADGDEHKLVVQIIESINDDA